jgi:hypothetical protein
MKKLKNNILPVGFWFYDEYGCKVEVIDYYKKWCIVKDAEHEEPYLLSIEFVKNIHNEMIEDRSKYNYPIPPRGRISAAFRRKKS